jgi:hypothetical protein
MNKLQVGIIINAAIWAAVIFAASTVLKSTHYADRILLILGGGAVATIILLGGILRRTKPMI